MKAIFNAMRIDTENVASTFINLITIVKEQFEVEITLKVKTDKIRFTDFIQ